MGYIPGASLQWYWLSHKFSKFLIFLKVSESVGINSDALPDIKRDYDIK